MDIISTWLFNILPVAPSRNADNLLDAFPSVNKRKYPVLFINGETIVLETEYSYEIKIEDMEGIERVIVPPTPIYARVTHATEATPLI